MSGKDHFRRCWAQEPVYSGGPVAAIVPERDGAGPVLLAMAFGCTLNVIEARTGVRVAQYDSPLEEDVILHVAATGSFPEAELKDKPDDGAADEVLAAGASGADGGAEDDELQGATSVVCGSVAFSTESRQIFALKLTYDAALGEHTLHLVQSWTAAQHAIACLRYSPTGSHLASGATDGGLRVWDVHHHHVTHNYRGKGGIVTFVVFSARGHRMAAGTIEGYISIIDFESKEVLIAGRPSTSPVDTGAFMPNDAFACVGRDRRVSLFKPGTLDELKAVVLRDHVMTAAFATPVDFFIGGPAGVVTQCRIDPDTGSVAVRCRSASVEHATEAEDAIRALTFVPESCLLADDDANQNESAKRHRPEETTTREGGATSSLPLVVAADGSQRLHFLVPQAPSAAGSGSGLGVRQLLSGYLDQIFDVSLLPPLVQAGGNDAKEDGEDVDEELSTSSQVGSGPQFRRIVASNSKDVMVFQSNGSHVDARLIGHSDLVTAVDVSADQKFVATASKDETMRLWDVATFACVGVGYGHDGAVNAVAMNPKMASASAFVVISVGSDEAIKLWDGRRPGTAAEGAKRWQPLQTTVNAHLGPVHCVTVAPNDTMVATGGKDKVVKLWTLKAKGLVKIGGLEGHRRAVNSVAFAPTDRLLISASNDGAVRVWSLATMSCARTLQVDKVGITQARFFNAGHQIVTTNAQGILRVWAVSAAEVVATVEAHDDRVWALAVAEEANNTYFVTGGADSALRAFEDYTEEVAQQTKQDRTKFVLMTQQLQNAIRRKDWAAAVALALQLRHPRHLRHVIFSWAAEDEQNCEDGLADIIATASERDLLKMLEFTRMWIANARHASAASLVVAALLRAHHFTKLRTMPAVKETIEALVGYNKRHEARATQLFEQLHFVDYLTRSLRPVGAANPFTTGSLKELRTRSRTSD